MRRSGGEVEGEESWQNNTAVLELFLAGEYERKDSASLAR